MLDADRSCAHEDRRDKAQCKAGEEERMTGTRELTPIETWHKTHIYTGHSYTGPGDVKPLPITRHVDEYGITLNSCWVLPSMWERIKFVFTGKITLRIYSETMPPVSLVAGDIFEPPPRADKGGE